MRDIRIDRWAHTLVHYSLRVKPEELIMIQATSLASPLIEAVYREILRVGAYPVPLTQLENCEELLLREGNDAQLSMVSPVQQLMAEKAQARLFIESESNPQALSGIDPSQSAKRRQAMRSIRETYRQREQAGEFRWCLTLYPTSGYAQDAGMSLSEFEEFVFDACFLNDPDPAARWQALSQQQQRLVDWLAGHKRVRIVGEGTELSLSIENRVFINSDGKRNFPSGEVFTSPVENSASGVIQFDIPSSYDGRAVQGVRLAFQEGKVVEASARQGEEYLRRMLELDTGARYLGEFAFGNNARVTRGTRNILFDEKIGGTVHLALGASYPETGGVNVSALHWDMVCDLRQKGEVWVDDTLFLKDGKIHV
jgi:aminopeptidase